MQSFLFMSALVSECAVILNLCNVVSNLARYRFRCHARDISLLWVGWTRERLAGV